MHLARCVLRVLASLVAIAALTFTLPGTARADRTPLVGSGSTGTIVTPERITAEIGLIVSIDPASVPCKQIATFDDVPGGPAPGSNYDGLVGSADMLFDERFLGQTLSTSAGFDVVSGSPVDPLTPEAGLSGQNLVVYAFTTNVLAGLGDLGFPDFDAIGEGSIAMYFPVAQSRVSFQLVGGNGGSATLAFYRTDGSLIDTVVISGLADLGYGFGTADGSSSISGILIQNNDPSGIGLDNVCHDGGVVSTHALSWGQLKTLYR